MRVSRRSWRAYQKAHEEVQRRARDEAMAYYATLPWDEDPALAERLMQAKVVELVDVYGLADGELSAMFYDELMAMQGADVPLAEIATAPPPAFVAQDVGDAIAHATTRETAREAVGNVAARQVKRVGLETTTQAASRDGAMWAWVCIGDTCAFCRTLGSQGWVRASKAVRAGQHAEHVHANCDCQFVVRPAGSTLEVEGYDPDALLDEYRDAASGGGWRAHVNAMRRDDYTQEFADRRNARRRELYALARAEGATPEEAGDA